MTKLFLSNKCGYTAGIYGCSNEYFNYTVITGKKVSTCLFLFSKKPVIFDSTSILH